MKRGRNSCFEFSWEKKKEEESGQKKDEVKGKDGKLDGLWSEWYENGKKKLQTTYKDGKKDGFATVWHSNGQMQGELNYIDGEKISEKWWNSKGEAVATAEDSIAE